MNSYHFYHNELQRLRDHHIYREMRTIESLDGAVTVIDGKEIIQFASNNYLGFATHPRLIAASIAATRDFGTGSGGSRLITGNFRLHEQLEKKIATFKGTEKALLFSSGYLANVGAVSALLDEGDVIFSDELNHASIIDGCRLSKAKTVIYKHLQTNDLEEKMRKFSGRKKLIVTDGVFSMDGDIAPLPEITRLAKKYDAMVMVDDAHATGVIGKGTAEYYGLENKVDLTIGTLSKAIGTEGGFAAGSETLIDYLKNKSRPFIFQTSLSPGVIAAASEAFRLLEEEPHHVKKLLNNAAFVRNELVRMGFKVIEGNTPIVAVLIGEEEKALLFAEKLYECGIYAPAIRTPTVPKGKSRIRITLMATHQQEQIDHLLNAFLHAGKELGVLPSFASSLTGGVSDSRFFCYGH
ncbi:8-amino-7-oxononanoate synthase [Pueribacillus theae]|uniref:8-amino-7-ketopelargonate synthase n=1 Tax=Pueribacillus theae TaxID=2171751 RepID=A0A2U1K7J5_9BACI|nr:8-amino-7-oxononanoate synthase [Pueribacillus theae]PWA13194.1 8-amino-7-oxononanoate synthase [Pueribacillus theae]